MHNCDTRRVCRMSHKSKVDEGIQCIEKYHKDNRADNIKIQMHHGGTFCIFVGSHGREKRSHTGTYILAHNDRDGHIKADRTGHTECLQNAH